MKVVIIGGGAGGAGAATRIRRLNEKASITIFAKSSYASYSNCALLYKFLTYCENFMVAYSPTVDTSFDATIMSARIVKHQADGLLTTIFISEVENYQKQGYIFIDARKAKELEGGIISGARLIAWLNLKTNLGEFDKNKKYFIYCQTGARSYNVCQLPKAYDIKNVVNLGGGYSHYATYRDFANVKEI